MTPSQPLQRSAVVTLGPPLERPWWWHEAQAGWEPCPLRFERVRYRDKASRDVSTAELPHFLLKMLRVYLGLRRRYDVVFTFECDLATFALAFWQTLLRHQRPRHVVLQFIMREKTHKWSSRLKYAAMRWCFTSLDKVICSATAEASYYREVFRWPAGKVAFVPFHTSRTVAMAAPGGDHGFVLTGGRTFRDFDTLLDAVRGTGFRTIVVASRGAVSQPLEAPEVEILEDLPLSSFDSLVRHSRVVVVPLQDTKISAGQLVLLHAMAAAKPVVATRTAATVDYINHGENGLLVPPKDPAAMRQALALVMHDPALRARLGAAARHSVLSRHLPHHYAQGVRACLDDARSFSG